jgi:hypothetical protein
LNVASAWSRRSRPERLYRLSPFKVALLGSGVMLTGMVMRRPLGEMEARMEAMRSLLAGT